MGLDPCVPSTWQINDNNRVAQGVPLGPASPGALRQPRGLDIDRRHHVGARARRAVVGQWGAPLDGGLARRDPRDRAAQRVLLHALPGRCPDPEMVAWMGDHYLLVGRRHVDKPFATYADVWTSVDGHRWLTQVGPPGEIYYLNSVIGLDGSAIVGGRWLAGGSDYWLYQPAD